MDFLLAYAALAFVLGGGLYIVVMLVAAAIAGTALAGVWRFRKRPWKMWLMLLIFAWGVLALWLNVTRDNTMDSTGYYKKVSSEQQDITIAACEKAELTAPKQLLVEGIVDEITNTGYSQLVSLLFEQKLKFVELRVNKREALGVVPALGPYIVHSGNAGRHWLVDKPIYSYVKVAVGNPTSDTCIHGDQLPADLLTSLWPHQGACITMTYLDRASARYALDYAEDVPANKDKTGQYRLVDRQQNITLARLPTYDDPQRPEASHLVRCRSPHAMLLKKLSGA